MAGNYTDKATALLCFAMVGFQVCCVYSYSNLMIRLLNVITFCSWKTFGECESRALELLSGPSLYLSMCSRGFGEKVRSSNC